MKKISAFFMALLPFLVVVLLFISGLLAKDFGQKTVQRIEMIQDSLVIRKEMDGELVDTKMMTNINVFPAAASDPTIYYTSSDENIAKIEKTTGRMTINGYGHFTVNAVAKQNISAKASCKIEVWDDKVHNVVVTNAKQAEFMSQNSQLQLIAKTIPEEKVKDKTLTYEIIEPTNIDGVSVSPTGLITVGYTNATKFQVKVTNPASGKFATVNVTIGQSIDTIGFKNDGNLIIDKDNYNLYNEVVTYPYTDEKKILQPSYFTFESSNPEQATIDASGNVKFTDKYVPGTFVDFTVKFAGLSSISCHKQIASSMNYYADVAFNKYSYQCLLKQTPQELSEITWSAYPVMEGKTPAYKLESSNDCVVVNNGKFYAMKEGTANLTVSLPYAQGKTLSDTCEVTITNSASKVLKDHDVKLGNVHYYALRKSLNTMFENSNITWTAAENDVAKLYDATNGIVIFKKAGSFKVTAKDVATGLSDTITLTCEKDDATIIDIEDSGEYTIAAGNKIIFKQNGNVVTPDLGAAANKFVKLADNSYIAAAGTQAQIEAKVSDITFYLLTTEDVVSIVPTNYYTNYITNKHEVNVAETIKMYPATATIDSWRSYIPSISYTYEFDDESAASVTDNVVTFGKIATVKIKASYDTITKNFTIKSFNGGNGKFSLTDGKTNKTYQSGSTISLSPSDDPITLTIDQYQVNDVESKGLADSFKVTQVNGDSSIIYAYEPEVVGNKLSFTFKPISGGSDIIKISNKSFTFIINFKVSNKEISDINLYSLGDWIRTDSSATDLIDVYSTDKLSLNIDIAPLSAKTEKVKVKFNDLEFEAYGNVDLSEGSKHGDKTLNWKTGTNILTLSSQNGSVVRTYYLNNKNGQDPGNNFTITQALDGKNIYLKAGANYVTLTIKLNGIANQDFYKKFVCTGLDQATAYGKYIIAPITAATTEHPEYTKNIKVNNVDFTITRDIVSKVVFPKNDNIEDEEKCGLQRVKVWGNTFFDKDNNYIDTYSMEVKLYDYIGNEITNLSQKKKAMDSLNILSGAKTAKYDEATGTIKVTFDSTKLYTANEIANNKFVNGEKNQYVAVATNYGLATLDTAAIANYDFIVVEGYNVNNEAQIQKVITDKKKKNFILQTNFGTEGKESTPFTLVWSYMALNDVYGNGYAINFNAMTKATKETKKANHIVIKHSINLEIMGCSDDYYQTLKGENLCFTMSTDGGARKNDPQIYAYCKIKNFFETFSGWSSETATEHVWTHFKNCLFSNDYENTNVCIESQNAHTNVIIEDCAFFNAGKVCMQVTNGGNIYFKGNVWVYNFHGSDIFDCFGFDTPTCELLWGIVMPIAENAGVLQKEQYGATKPVLNSYLVTLLSNVYFYAGTDDKGEDIWVQDSHGSEKAANYLKRAVSIGILGMNAEFWCTVNPPLPLQGTHSPCFSDEFKKEIIQGETVLVFNLETRNKLIDLITRH